MDALLDEDYDGPKDNGRASRFTVPAIAALDWHYRTKLLAAHKVGDQIIAQVIISSRQ